MIMPRFLPAAAAMLAMASPASAHVGQGVMPVHALCVTALLGVFIPMN